MKKTILCVLVLFTTVAVAGAEEVPGQPGQIDMSYAIIDLSQDVCQAIYVEPWVNGSGGFGNGLSKDQTRIKVTINKNKVNVWCKFPDTSGIYEKNAEVGVIDGVCTLVLEDGTTYVNGSGKAVSAANITDEDGGNACIHCQFDIE